jgi:hypothetical protein
LVFVRGQHLVDGQAAIRTVRDDSLTRLEMKLRAGAIRARLTVGPFDLLLTLGSKLLQGR